MGITHLGVTGTVRACGHLSLKSIRPDGSVRGQRDGRNVVCATGYTAIAAALAWSGVQDQAAALGLTTATWLTPLWGAVGSGSGTPSNGDTALWSELGRQQVGATASSPATVTVAATVTWLFYFGSPPSAWTVTEAGAFTGASSTAGSWLMLDHWAFSPALTVPVTDTMILEVSLGFGP